MTNEYTIVHVVCPLHSEHELLDAAHQMCTCYEEYDPTAHACHPSKERLSALTKRELEVLQLLARGVPGPEIAHRLKISYTTVRTHTQNMLKKLGVHSTIEAIALLFNNHD